MNPRKVLFVCLGNICRSPLAEGVFRQLVKERGLSKYYEIESCGTGHWHVGEQAHPDTRRVAKTHGISLEAHRARQLNHLDFDRFDYLVAMDRSNRRDIERLGSGGNAQVVMLRDFDPEGNRKGAELDVPDPYYEGGFEGVHEIVLRSCRALLDELEKKRAS